MSGYFPNAADGGLPPNPSDLLNPARAFAPIVPPTSNAALYYGNGCDVRLRPEVINSLISELEATCDQAKVAYDYSKLTNVETAIRYLIQRGLPCGAVAVGGPNNYVITLDPPATAYNNFMTLVVVPAPVTNNGSVMVNANNLGYVKVLRNDGLDLKFDDFRANMPIIISYKDGAFYLVSLARSQVPLIATGAVDAWVRTDGNDITGDGTSNTTDKAFRTIQGAWNAVGSRYAASPLLQINIRLGIPGSYETAQIGPYGGQVMISGDPSNRVPYRIVSSPNTNAIWALRLAQANVGISGVNLVMNRAENVPNWACCLRCSGGSAWIDRCQFTLEATNGGACSVILLEVNAGFNCVNDHIVEGNSKSCNWGMFMMQSYFGGNPPGAPVSAWAWRNINFTASSHSVQDASVCSIGNMAVTQSAVTGSRYAVGTNSILYQQGQTLPGTTAGTVGSQGLVF